jgi:hypothetical protein
MAWNRKGGYRHPYLEEGKTLYNKARAWAYAKVAAVPTNAFTEQLRNGSMFYNDHIIVDYDFSEVGSEFIYNRAPNGIGNRIKQVGTEWVNDTSKCTSGISTSGGSFNGNARGTAEAFITAVKTNKQFGIDFWMMPNDFTDGGPPRILEISPETGTDSWYNTNISILQGDPATGNAGNHLQVRLRATNESGDLDGQGSQMTIASNCLSAGVMQHVGVSVRSVAPSFDASGNVEVNANVKVAIFVNGTLRGSNTIELPYSYTYDDIFDSWNDSYKLSLCDASRTGSASAGREWDGGIFRLRFWDVSLPTTLNNDLYLDGPDGDLTCNQVPDNGQQGRPGGSVHTAPTATDDNYNVSFGNVKVLDVLANDYAYQSNTIIPSTLTATSQPVSGTLTSTPAGKFTYSATDYDDTTPAATDMFTYKVRDTGGKWSSDASVFVTIASALAGFNPTEPFDYALNPPGRYAPYGHSNSQISFTGGAVSGALVDKYGIDWPIPWKSTTGPNNDHFKIEKWGANAHNTEADIVLSGFNLLYPQFDGFSTGRIDITTSGTYENFISYKPIKILVDGVTLKNFIVDVCLGGSDPARQRLWDLHNSTAPYDTNVALENLGSTNDGAGPASYYNNANSGGYNYKRKSGHAGYGIQANDGQSGPNPENTLLIDGIIRGGSSTTVLCGHNMTIKRCDLSEGGGDAIKNSGHDVCCVGNWIHHNGFVAGSHADAFQTTSQSSGIDMLGNFVDMPFTNNSGPYGTNAVYIAGQTKGSLVNVNFVGNWAMGGNHAISYGMGDKWQNFAVSSAIPTSASASENFSLTSGQFAATPEASRQLVASSVDHPLLRLQKRICKESGENYFWEVPSNLYSFINASGIIVSGDASVAGGWDEAQCSGNTDSAAWGWVDQDDRPCDLMFRPTLTAEDQFGDTQPGGRYTSNSSNAADPMKGNYRLVNKSSCQVLGYYGDTPNSNYAPKPMLNFVVADNRWGQYSQHTFGAPDGAGSCFDFITGGPKVTMSGTVSGLLYSGNVWDYPSQLMGPAGSNPPATGFPDYNTIHENMGSDYMNDICIPLSGLPHLHVGGGRISLGECDDLSAGIPWTGEPGSAAANFDINVGDAPCAPPWCL